MGNLRHAFRSLRRTPWYTVTAIAVVALGTTLTATVFAVVDGVLFKPLPYARVNEVFGLSPGVRATDVARHDLRPASGAHLRAWRAAAPEARFAAFNASGFKVTIGGHPVEMAQV